MVAAVVVAALVATAGYQLYQRTSYHRYTAYFSSGVGLYQGDDVRVLGVDVGKVDRIEPQPGQVKVTMSVRSEVDVPADARAVIIASSLVSARFVQLAPAYTGGPTMADGAEIPLNRTAVPVEWDDIKSELARLATSLGPVGDDKQGSFGRLVDVAANNLDGNGTNLRNTVRELSQVLQTFADGRSDLFGTIRNLQAFTEALSNSNDQIVQFGGRLASVSQVLADSSDQLGRSLDDLDVAIADLQRFLETNRGVLGESVQRLGAATAVLAEKRPQLERVLHLAPTALQNFYQIYKPAMGSLTGVAIVPNFRNPVNFVCGSVRSLQDDDSDRSADLCAQMLAPALNSLLMNYPPLLTNPVGGIGAFPDQLEYSPAELSSRAQPAAPVAAAPVAAATPGPPTVVPDLGALLLPGGGR